MSKISVKEAVEGLTVGEVRVIERHFQKEMNDLSGTEQTVATVWAYERRRTLGTGEGRPDWDDFDNWTMKQLGEYFADEEIELDPSNPETNEGKDDSLAA